MFSGTSYLRCVSATLRNVTSKFGHVESQVNSSSHRNIHRSVACLADSYNSSGSDGFAVENMDSESKEKLMSLKSVLSKNSYFDKYKEKIMKAQKSYPKDFLALLEGLKTSKQKSLTSDYVPTMSSQTKHRLDEVMKVDLLMELDRDDISFIWQEYHQKKGLVGACMQCSVFQRIRNQAAFCNMFALPLTRTSGYDFHVVQFSNNSFYFTPLISWQTYKENSPVTLTLTYFDELKDKDIILLRGEFDKNAFSQTDAQELAVQVHLYYSQPDIVRGTLLEKFVSNPNEFDHNDLIVELQRMKESNKKLFGSDESESTNTGSS